MTRNRTCLALALSCAGVLVALAAEPANAQPSAERVKGTPELIKSLAQGGYVIYFRHGHTHWQQKLIESGTQTEGRHDLANCATQRNLDEIGRDDAARIHQALTAARVPVGKVLGSLYCRPSEYVSLITGRVPVRTQWLTGLSTPDTLKEIKREVATAPAPGTNVFLGGHGDRPFDLTGLVIQEGDALVFDPRNHRADDPAKFAPVAWIKPGEWAALAGVAATAGAPAATTLAGVRVGSTPQHDESNLRASLPALTEGRVIDRGALSRQVHLARDNPAKNVEVQFAPSTRPDGSDANLMTASVKPWSLAAGLNNISVAGNRRERVLLGGDYVNLWNRDHQVAFLASTAPGLGDRADNLSMAYRAPLPALGGMLEFKATRARDGGGTDADYAAITGAGHSTGVRYRQHLTPLADYHHQLSMAIDDRQWSGANLRSRPLTIGYRGHWEENWLGWQFDARAVTNLSGGAGNDTAAYALARPGARRGWSALRIDGAYVKILTYDIRLIARARAQYSGDALIPGEQFALGTTLEPWGSSFSVWPRAPWLQPVGVRGLPERALAGDSGAQASIELWSRRLVGQDLRVGGFFDAGTVRRKDPAAGVTGSANASSLGAAMHYQWRGNVALSMTAAHVLHGGGVVAKGGGRVDAALMLRY